MSTANSDECLQYSTLVHYAKYTKHFMDDTLYMVDPECPEDKKIDG